MSSSYEKSVKGGTKIKLAPPKSKYVEHILRATDTGEAGVAEIFRTMPNRLRDSTWTIVFKALIIVHIMIREGSPNATLRFLAENPSRLAISDFSDVQQQGGNIRNYYTYLFSRVKAYKNTKIDWVRDGEGRLKRLSVDKGLLRETETVQKQISSLISCDLLSHEAENEITITAFRLLTMDLLILYHVMNEGTINVLGQIFEMSKVDAERALGIYKRFVVLTDSVVGYLKVARRYEHVTKLQIPTLKHAPTSLAKSLEDYLQDPDFEVNRRQYLAQKQGKTNLAASEPQRKNTANSSEQKSTSVPTTQLSTSQAQSTTAQNLPVKNPPADLIDFFESIDTAPAPVQATGQQQFFQNTQFQPNKQFMQQQPQQIQTDMFRMPVGQQQMSPQGFAGTNPFAQMQSQAPVQQPQQPMATGQGYNPFATQNPQPQQMQTSQPTGFMPQHSMSTGSQFSNTSQSNPFGQNQMSPNASTMGTGQISPQATNPFRQSTLIQSNPTPMQMQPTSGGSQFMAPQQSGTSSNPFNRSFTASPPIQSSTSPFGVQQPTNTSMFNSMPSSFSSAPAPELGVQRTGTNPFAKSPPPAANGVASPPPLQPNATGSTNPFRQSMFINQQTGQGWQAHQGTMGGLENMNTIPVFPRPGQSMPSIQESQNGWA